MFAEDFDRPVAAGLLQAPAPEPAAPAEPVFSQADYEAARAKSFAHGRLAGMQAARTEQSEQAANLLAELARAIADMEVAWQAAAQAQAEALARTLCAAMAAAFPALCASHGPSELASVVRELLPALAHEPAARLRVNDTNLAAVHDLLGQHVPNITLVADAGLGPADMRLEFAYGEACRDGGAIWARIAAILTAHDLLPGAILETQDVH